MTNMMQTDNQNRTDVNSRAVVIARVIQELRRQPDFNLSKLNVDNLDPRDAKLAQAIYIETIRRLITLEHLLNHCLTRPFEMVETKLQAALLVGTCQLMFFDHLPDHAVVNETVKWVGARVRPKARGMANAVLRKMIKLRGEIVDTYHEDSLPLSDGRYLMLTAPIIPENNAHRISVQTSHPIALVQRWSHLWDQEHAEKLMLHSLLHAPIIVSGVSADEVAAINKAASDAVANIPHNDTKDIIQPTLPMVAHTQADYWVWTEDIASLRTFLMQHTNAKVQDPSSAKAIRSTIGMKLDGKIIIDYCAGVGTKTKQLAELHPNAKIIATDKDDRRYQILTKAFQNTDHVKVVPFDTIDTFAGKASLLVLDVPCSNTGVLARRTEAKYRADIATLESLTKVQKQIFAESLRLLDFSHGQVLYSTCSIEPIENQHQVNWVQKWHDLKLISDENRVPAGLPGDEQSIFSDGGYHALLG